MKKVILFTLALLMFAGSMQPIMAMQGAFGPELEESLDMNPAQTTSTPTHIAVVLNPRPTTDMQRNQIILGGLVGQIALRQTTLSNNQQALEGAVGNLIDNVVIEQNNKRAYKAEKAKAISAGRFAGAHAGFFSGMGYGYALGYLLSPTKVESSNALSIVGPGASYYASGAEKKIYYNSLRTTQTITPEQKVKLKKAYHAEEFKTNTLTTIATAIGFVATTLAIVHAVVPVNQKPVVQSASTSFWNYLPHAVLGITALKWLTYTGMRSYKKWMRGDQPPRRRQQPYLRAGDPV